MIYGSFFDDLEWSMTGSEWWQVLDIPKDSTPEQVKQRYKTLCKRWHPDLNHSPNSTQRFNKIHEAYQQALNK